MTKTPDQLPLSARPPRGRRFPSGPACIACLLVLPAAGLGLLARTAFRDAPLARTQEHGVGAAGDSQPTAGSLQEILAHPDIIPTHHHPLLGRQAPDFELADVEGKVWSVREFLDGHPMVLLFSYGFHCIHCNRQLGDINRDLPLFREVGARVVVISADPPEVMRRSFQQRGPFGFSILSDSSNKVARAYRVFRTAPDGQVELRHGTFLIDRDGTVQWVNVGDAPFARNPALFSQLVRMEGRWRATQAGPAAENQAMWRRIPNP
jgi:peroxiredoxin